jgi:hypothetical protein
MSLENSPPLKAFERGMPPQPPDPTPGRRRTRIAIIVLSLILGGLLVNNLWQSQAVALFNGNGTITGTVHDASGQPAVAEIMIERTKIESRSDASGRFMVAGVPAGEHLLVVARDNLGVEYPIIAVAGSSIDIGIVRVETTAVPLP